MCVILSVYKQKEFNDKTHYELLTKVNNLAKANPDGFSVIGLNYNDNKKRIYREVKYNEKVFSDILRKFDVVNLHLRLGTAGTNEPHNLHFWKCGNWYFGHNGTLLKLSNDKKFSDSYLFWRKLVEANCFCNKKHLKLQRIEKLANENDFWGRVAIVNPEAKKIFYLGDFTAYLIKKEAMVISSSSMVFSKINRCLGFDFESEVEFPSVGLDGINLISLNNKMSYELADSFGDRFSAGSYHTSCYSQSTDLGMPISGYAKKESYQDRQLKQLGFHIEQ